MKKILLKRKYAELVLLNSVPNFVKTQEHSRLSGLQRKIVKITNPYLRNIQGLSKKDFSETLRKIDAFGKVTGWSNTERHIGTLISFCLDMAEQSPIKYDKKIYTVLLDIVFHLESNNELYPLSCVGGAVATEKWKQLFK